MHERLLENWLDSASERSYQAPLSQMLSNRGFTILHSTRHHPIEFGKDIVAVDPKGVPCAFQLKGNPSSRLTLAQFREIEHQLFELASYPLDFPGIRPTAQHRAYLVTNGQIEEDVRLAMRNLNRRLQRTKVPPIEPIARGTLLKWAKDLGLDLWPSELQDIDSLLRLRLEDGRHLMPIENVHRLLCASLSLNDKRKVSARELTRRIDATGVLVAVAIATFSRSANHYAVITAWMLYIAYVIAACGKSGVGVHGCAGAAIGIVTESIFASLHQLWLETSSRSALTEGAVLVDSPFYRWRITTLLGLFSIYWMWAEEVGWPDQEQRPRIEKFLDEWVGKMHLWGEGAVPHYLATFWCMRRRDSTIKPEKFLASLAATVARVAATQPPQVWPNPYFAFSDKLRHSLKSGLGSLMSPAADPLANESASQSSFYAVGLLHMLVRTNLKSVCKAIWPDISRLDLREFAPAKEWEYCLWRSEEGQELSVQPPVTKEWKSLVDEARDVSGAGVPAGLRGNKYLWLLFLVVCPFRGTPSAIRLLDRLFNDQWMIAAPIGMRKVTAV